MKTPDTLLGKGIYTIPFGARMVDVPPISGRRWTVGYTFESRFGLQPSAPVLFTPAEQIGEARYLTFYHVVEIMFVKALRSLGLTLPYIREACRIAAQDYDVKHPFAAKMFQTDGRRLFTKIPPIGNSHKRENRVLHEITSGQIVIEDFTQPYFKNLDYVGLAAARYWPLGNQKGIVIDPMRSLGRPIDAASGVSTYVLYRMYENVKSDSMVADWYGVKPSAVRSAVEFERSIRAGA